MRKYHRPSLKMLGTFEVAARLNSFKMAADELNVTPGAVSHQVRALEEQLGIPLFDRASRSVALTKAGYELRDVVASGLHDIDRVVQNLLKSDEVDTVSIASTTAVSSLWLTPRLAQFWRNHGDIAIIQEVRDRPLRRPLSHDLAIEYALEPPNEQAEILFEDQLIPMCSPNMIDREITTLDELAVAPLIHLEAAETNWTSWPNWFSSLGFNAPLDRRHRVNNYAIALQMAQDGQGIVLGWKYLVQPLLKSGQLIPLTNFQIDAPGKFYLLKPDVNQKPNTQILKRWLLDHNR